MLDAHLLSHDGYGPGTKAQGAVVPKPLKMMPCLGLDWPAISDTNVMVGKGPFVVTIPAKVHIRKECNDGVAMSKHHPSQGAYRIWLTLGVVVAKQGGCPGALPKICSPCCQSASNVLRKISPNMRSAFRKCSHTQRRILQYLR